MPGPEFFQTYMGKHFYESTAPRIARALERIADALEARNQKATNDQADGQEAVPVQVQACNEDGEDS